MADRFHLLKNLGDCLERLAQRVGIPVMAEELAEGPLDRPPPEVAADQIVHGQGGHMLA